MIVAGHNFLKVLCAESNNDSVKNPPAISPPIPSFLDIPSLLSYSVYDEHAVIVTRDGKGFFIGNGIKGKITINESNMFKQFNQLIIKDKDNNECVFLSAVCGTWYTLYLLQSHPTDQELKIAFSYYNTPNETPLFINTGERNPIALYGGHTVAAVICSDGSVIILNEGIFHTPSEIPPILILPNDERAISVACMEEMFIILSNNGKLYKYVIPSEIPAFPLVTEIEELKEVRIAQISGTAGHCLAVADDGKVYGRGTNESGRIGISEHSKVPTFSEITELKDYKIRVALAGCYHSLFLTTKGRVLSCGVNYDGELLLDSGPSNEDVLTPVKSSIRHGATFGITGIFTSALFVDCMPPPNTPNIINKGKLPTFSTSDFVPKLPDDIIFAVDENATNNIILSKVKSHPVMDNELMDNSESGIRIQVSPGNSAKNSAHTSPRNSAKNSAKNSAHASAKNSTHASAGNSAKNSTHASAKNSAINSEKNSELIHLEEEESVHSKDVNENSVNDKKNENQMNSSGSQSIAFEKFSMNSKDKTPLKTKSQSTPKSHKSQSPKERSTPKSSKTNQESSEMRSLSSTSVPQNTNANASKKVPILQTPASKLSVSSNNDTKNHIASESKLSMSTYYGEFSEVSGLRQQILEMKELLDSKDKEIQRLTRLNNALLDNDRDLQHNLGECWDNQQNKIEEHEMHLSKRRKE